MRKTRHTDKAHDNTHPMRKRLLFTVKSRVESRRLIIILVMAGLIGAGLLAVAVAQSSRASFSLNAPASFPVDI